MQFEVQCVVDESHGVPAMSLRGFKLLAQGSRWLVDLVVPEEEPDGKKRQSLEFVCAGVRPPRGCKECEIRPLEFRKSRSIVRKTCSNSQSLSPFLKRVRADGKSFACGIISPF